MKDGGRAQVKHYLEALDTDFLRWCIVRAVNNASISGGGRGRLPVETILDSVYFVFSSLRLAVPLTYSCILRFVVVVRPAPRVSTAAEDRDREPACKWLAWKEKTQNTRVSRRWNLYPSVRMCVGPWLNSATTKTDKCIYVYICTPLLPTTRW